MLLLIISERVEPGEHASIALPGWFASGCGRSGDLFQGFPLRFQIGPGIVVGCIEAHMAEPAAYDCNVDARRDEVHGRSEECSVGNECVRTGRYRWSLYH